MMMELIMYDMLLLIVFVFDELNQLHDEDFQTIFGFENILVLLLQYV